MDLADKLVQRAAPNTLPTDGGEEMPEPQGLPEVLRPTPSPVGETTSKRKLAEEIILEEVPAAKKHKDDTKPWDDDMFAFLTGEDYAPDMAADDLIAPEALPPEARKCPEHLRRMVRNAHRNLGHPSNFALVRLMRTAKCHPDLIAYAGHMQCPTCLRRKPPERLPRVSMPHRPTRFNHVVGLDLKIIKDASGERYYLLNIVDLATTFNICVVLPNKESSTVMAAWKQNWALPFGTPEKTVTDRGREFFGVFQEMVNDSGMEFHMIPTEAPWQHGMVERHGGVLGDIIVSTVEETVANGLEEMKDVALHACMAKNRRPGRTGFSPRALVFGVDERLMASGLNHYLEQPDDASISLAQADPVMKRSMQIRKQAMIALVALDCSLIGRACEALRFILRTVPRVHITFAHPITW